MDQLLTPATRPSFHTLLDALILTAEDATQDAIIYIATEQPAQHITRQQIRDRATGYANSLRKLGLAPGDLIIIAHTQSLESIYAFWGALLLGAVPAMFPTLTEKFDPQVYMSHMVQLVQLSDVKAIVTTDAFAPELRQVVACQVIASQEMKEIGDWRLENQSPISNPQSPNLQSPNPDYIAFLQHSSGTTGLQKGVALSHTAVLNQLASYSEAIQLNQADVVVSWLPLYHDMGLIAGFLLPLVQGIPLVLMSPFDWVSHPALLLRAIAEYKGTLCWLPNFAYNHCARRIRKRDKAGLSLASMRLFINCSEPVRHDSQQLFLEAFATNGVTPTMLGVSYAMAENTFAVSQTTPGQPARLDIVAADSLSQQQFAQPVASNQPQATIKVSCGRPLPGTAVKILDSSGQQLPDRHVGQIAIQSNCMLSEYYKRPDLAPFQDGWFLTGDLGYLAEGELFVNGRAKDLIINAGKNVYPQDIEAIVNTVAGVHAGRAVCFGVPDEREGTELIAIIAEVENEDPAWRKELNKAIRLEVARQSTVSVSFVHLVGPKWLLKTSSGKIARAANRDKWRLETGNR
jgi:acyl-CoA synthetase (AMP-forming)/AMP-acid ligase II